MPRKSIPPQRLLIVENQTAVREAFSHYFGTRPEFKVVGTAGDADSALRLIGKCSPDLVLLDLILPGRHGVEILRRGNAKKTRPKFLVLTDSQATTVSRDAINSGADGVITKMAGLEEICMALNTLAAGRSLPVDAKLVAMITRVNGAIAAPIVLTKREDLILRLVAAGGSNKEIANNLKLSQFTVENHRASIRRKLGLRTTQQLVIYAMQQGLLDLPLHPLDRKSQDYLQRDTAPPRKLGGSAKPDSGIVNFSGGTSSD